MANKRKRRAPRRKPVFQAEKYSIRALHEDREYGMYWYAWIWKLVRPVLIFMCSALMAIGIIELISERIAGLDRVLSGKRLFRGFGALTAGGLLGIPMAILGHKRNIKRAAAMLAGSTLCAVFAGLLLAGYRKQ